MMYLLYLVSFLLDNHDIISIKVFELTREGGQDDSIDYAEIEPSADFFAPPRGNMEQMLNVDVDFMINDAPWTIHIVVLII